MFRTYEGLTADDVWRAVAEDLVRLAKDHEGDQASRVGATVELLHTTLSISEPSQRWVLSRRPAMNVAFALAEVVWIVSGRRDAKFLTAFNSRLSEHVGREPFLYGAYGHRLRQGLGFDQLNQAFRALQANPDTRQVVLQIWDGRKDLPRSQGRPRSTDIPCNVVSILKVRNGRLEWLQIMRSNDVFLGLPYNLVQFTCLQEVMAGWIGIPVGSYNHVSDSLHVYRRDIRHIEASKPKVAGTSTDSLSLPHRESVASFGELERRVARIIHPDATPSDIRKQSAWNDAVAFGNLLRVLCAEISMRRGWSELCTELMSGCTNAVYRDLHDRWRAVYRRSVPRQTPGF